MGDTRERNCGLWYRITVQPLLVQRELSILKAATISYIIRTGDICRLPENRLLDVGHLLTPLRRQTPLLVADKGPVIQVC
jgi:hypothetical protein